MLCFIAGIGFSRDFNTWLVMFVSGEQPPEYFAYDRRTRRARFLFCAKPELSGRSLGRMIGFDFLARDGLRLQAYLSLPPSVGESCRRLFTKTRRL